jgi:hypothetical protein
MEFLHRVRVAAFGKPLPQIIMVDSMDDSGCQSQAQSHANLEVQSLDNNQSASMMLSRLPLEIRLQIYSEIIRDPTPKIHLYSPKIVASASAAQGLTNYHYEGIQHMPCMLEVAPEKFNPLESYECCTHWKCHRISTVRQSTGQQPRRPAQPPIRDGRRISGTHTLLQLMKTSKKA